MVEKKDDTNRSEYKTITALWSGQEKLKITLGEHPLISGVIAVNIISATLKGDYSKTTATSKIHCGLTIKNYIKRTRAAKKHAVNLKWNELHFFPVQINRDRRHPFNRFHINVYLLEQLLYNKIEHQDIGSLYFHIHDIAKGSPTSGEFPLMDNNRNVGSIKLEIYFTYGSFGYGYSPQLQMSAPRTNSHTSKTTLYNPIENSMLLRIHPPKDRYDFRSCTLVPKAVPLPDIIPEKFRSNVVPQVIATDEKRKPKSGVRFADMQDKNNAEEESEESEEEENMTDFPILFSKLRNIKDMQQKLVSYDRSDRLQRLRFLYTQVANPVDDTVNRIDESLHEKTYNSTLSRLPLRYFLHTRDLK